MKKIITIITDFFNENNSYIAISEGKKRLAKKAEKEKFYFSKADVEEKYGSVENLIQELPAKGFSNDTILELKRLYEYGERRVFSTVKRIKIKFNNTMETQNSTPNITLPLGMGSTPVRTEDWLTSKIKESRYDELIRDYEKIKDELSDVKSKLRIARENNNSLQLKLDTAQERFDLKLQQELINKKGFFESPAFERVVEGMGSVLPQIMAAKMATPDAAALGSPNVSQVKQNLISAINQEIVTDAMANQLLLNLNEIYNEQQKQQSAQ